MSVIKDRLKRFLLGSTISPNLFIIISFFILILAPRPILAAEEVKFWFAPNLCDAYWSASEPGQLLTILPCPGEVNDSRGFVRIVPEDQLLEDNSRAERTIETHPMWQTDGWIAGAYSLGRFGIAIERGDRLIGQIGFLQGAAAGQVRFIILYDQNPIEPGGEIVLFEAEKSYDGMLDEIDIDLSSFAGQSGDVILKVDAEGLASQDWAIWKELRIVRPILATSTHTQTIRPSFTPTMTDTMTSTMTSTGTVTATRTVIPTPTPPMIRSDTPTSTVTQTFSPTPTPTEIVTFPPPAIITAQPRPCACFESNKIETYISGNDGFAVGYLMRDKDLLLLTVVDDKASGNNGLFTIMDPLGIPINTFEARFTPNDVIAVGDVWGDASEEEILVGIDEDHLVYVYNAWGELVETKSIYYTRYDILAVGNVLDGPGFEGDEIILASDERDVFVIYSRMGTPYTYELDWNFDGNSVPGIKSGDHSDGLTIGNVVGDELDEIIYVENKNGDQSMLYLYNGFGSLLAKTRIRYTKFDALASGDVIGNNYDEVLVGIDEDRAIYVLDSLKGILKMIHGRVTAVDVIAAGKFNGHEKESIFIAVDEDRMIYLYLQE